MDYKDAETILSLITYKPNWTIKMLLASDVDGIEIRFSYRTENVNDRNDQTTICGTLVIFMESLREMPKEEFLKTIERQIKQMEIHEMHEWLKFNKTHFKDPHEKDHH